MLKGLLGVIQKEHPDIVLDFKTLLASDFVVPSVLMQSPIKKGVWQDMLCTNITKVGMTPEALMMLAVLAEGSRLDYPTLPVSTKFQERIAKTDLSTTKLNILCANEFGKLPALVVADKDLGTTGLYTPPNYKNFWLGKINYNTTDPLTKFVAVLHEWGHKVQLHRPDAELIQRTNRLEDVRLQLDSGSFMDRFLYANMPLEVQARNFVNEAIVLHPQKAQLRAISDSMDR
jgi:hypothetical protein